MKSIIEPAVESPRSVKLAFLMVLDFCVFPVLLWLCYAIRQFDLGAEVVPNLAFGSVWASVIAVVSLFIFGVYRFIVRTYSELFMVKLGLGTSLTVAGLYALAYFTDAFIPTSIPLMFGFLMFAWVWFSRGFIRFIVRSYLQADIQKKRVAIYGAGNAGQQIAAALYNSDEHLPVLFIDDDPSLTGQQLGRLKVYDADSALKLLAKKNVDEILIALPSVGRMRKSEIVKFLEPAHIKITEIPGLTKLVDGEIRVSDIQEVDIIDLLGRDPVPPVPELLAKNIQDKMVLVTGAGGSIGSELCRQIVKNKPKALVIYELTEFALYSIDKELRLNNDVTIIPILGSVLDQAKLERVMEQYRVQTVYHAAAYKHVPLVECNPLAGLKNNAIGTAFSLNAAVKTGVETFVLISTDKAVRPTNVMGASKRMAELYCQAMAEAQDQTQISIVRFGNVLGSSGSVVPLFKQQIAKGGPITVTHPEVTRYFMTIPEASQLVIQAGALGQGGDVFLLDMGEPVRIQDLARQMIALSGLKVRETGSQEGDIEIQYSGLRPGEKLYEELLIDADNTEVTQHSRILRSYEKMYPLDELLLVFERMHDLTAIQSDIDWALAQLEHYVDGYVRGKEVKVN
ncbi:nucleoside-diphosphate sugar epimerase [Acinetobacter sp. KAM398]|uniref:nucleoside-diphosphate sugar epimerase/dehydratase n=1 Tax=unclassified Acinetobacter TaxID=196816 RepID=UPI001F2D0D33|nr:MULTISPECIES: nucleoside-diphosphate sugar epimerase/dehydratase [unclassified Acinetobacter]GJC32561.1 nucleoside-diphosphate sugar epimerase [Acinetobacter sp. KAM392]GJC35381.1 nucleoside-diphosphate sugar epimerase [Acinetobacter sp. KAM393]GJC38203.1 nucleoside-diphosphate sugar epimerase [Acinetobacter sp. KAM394]GJC41001.1 nucleoside-diphosphate sugar epimerase [Acinetobacter sp. KAM395]GJC43817.1 nucleoside-diphosphate sugar epimerase [Acinetobacter sp. KAM396]